VAVLMFDLPALRQLALKVVTPEAPLTFFAVQELKFAALCVVFVAAVAVGATALRDPSRVPPPRI
jgi:hypothetical protein